MKRLLLLGLLLTAACGLVFAGGSQEQKVEGVQEVREITFADQGFSYTTAAAEAFKQYVEEKTDGLITVTIINWKALGSDRDVIDQLRIGEVEMFNATTGSLSGVVPFVQMTNLPFLFENRYVGWMLFTDNEYLAYVQQQWLKESNNTIRILGAAENSIRNLYTTRGPVKTPSDLGAFNIKMRVPTIPLYVDLFTELGAPSIVPVPAAERYTSLQTGLIDGTEGGLGSAWQAGLLEVCDYVTLTGHMFDHHYYVINNQFYESLSAAEQKIIDEAGELAAWVQSFGVKEAEAESLQLMIDADKVIYEPKPEELMEWRNVGIEVGTRLLSEIVPQEYMTKSFDAVDRVSKNLDMTVIESKEKEIARYLK